MRRRILSSFLLGSAVVRGASGGRDDPLHPRRAPASAVSAPSPVAQRLNTGALHRAKPAQETGAIDLAEGPLCHIEILKSGTMFLARSHLNGTTREYKNAVFEDMLTEIVVDLQEEIQE